MSVTIGHITFDDVSYDSKGDVIYLSVGEPRDAADSEETPEGHVVRYGTAGEIVGLTLISPRHLIAREGVVRVTLPQEQLVEATEIESLFTAA